MHNQVLIKVNAFVDKGIAPLVEALNAIDGLITYESCEDTTAHTLKAIGDRASVSGSPSEAWVTFTYGLPPDNLHELVDLLDELAIYLRSLDLYEDITLSLEWFGDHPAPSAVLSTSKERITKIAQAIRKFAHQRPYVCVA